MGIWRVQLATLRSCRGIADLLTTLMRAAAAVLAACAALLAPVQARAEQDVVSLSLDEALIVAQQAVLRGDLSLGYAMARRLADADATNARAQLIIAATAPSLGLAPEGRRAGKAAWRLTHDPGLRFEIARYTAKAAFVEGRMQAAQFWLRRAADVSPTPADYAQTADDIQSLRDGQRLRYTVDLSLSPSDNLNNGVRTGFLTIDDWFTLATLSADAQALSGVRAVGQAHLTYALESAQRTAVGLRAYATANQLSVASANSVKGVLTGSDLNVLQLEATLAHEAHWPGTTWPVLVTGAVGNTWVGRLNLGSHLRVEAVTPLSREQALRLTLSGEVQSQDDGATYGLAASIDGQQRLGEGAMSWQLGLRQTHGADVNQTYRQISSDIGYAFGKPFGPMTLTLRAGGTIRDYVAYDLVIANVTGGRQDYTAMLGVDAVFQDMSVLGYAPRVSLTARTTDSNISRFETREIGVSFGIQSKF